MLHRENKVQKEEANTQLALPVGNSHIYTWFDIQDNI